MQTPPAIRASEPDNKVFCLCLPGVGFANLVGSVAGDLELSGLESRSLRSSAARQNTSIAFLPNDRRTRRQNLGIFGKEASHTQIIITGGGGSKVCEFPVQ